MPNPSPLCGIGLRAPHYQDLLRQKPPLAFLEVHSENFFGEGGQPLAYLRQFREAYPISLHGVGMSLGSADGLNEKHVAKLKRLIAFVEPRFVSEHLCWVGVNGRYLNDLLPLPYTEESLAQVVQQVTRLQDAVGREIMVENVSSYLEFAASTIPEWEFVAAVASRTGCKVLLDVNNIYVNATNQGFDAATYIHAIAPDSVGEIHLAGFQDVGDMLIDTHGSVVSDAVWALFQETIAHTGPRPTLIEWDTDIPTLDVLLGEAARAESILQVSAVGAHAR